MKSSKSPQPSAPNRQMTIDVDVARTVRNFFFGVAAVIAALKSPETAKAVVEAATEAATEVDSALPHEPQTS